jgi:ribose 1,5-bisphosphokinase PhnN
MNQQTSRGTEKNSDTARRIQRNSTDMGKNVSFLNLSENVDVSGNAVLREVIGEVNA